MRDIVPTHDDELIQHLGDDALARMRACGVFIIAPARGGIGKAHETFVGPTMVMTFEAENQFPTRVRTSETEGREDDLGGGVVEPHELGGRDHLLDTFGDLDLEFALRGPMRTQLRLGTDGLGHTCGGVTVEQRALAELEIEVVIAIDVPEVRTATAREVERHGGFHLADTTVYAGGDAALGAGEERLRLSEGVGHSEKRDEQTINGRCGSRWVRAQTRNRNAPRDRSAARWRAHLRR